MSIANLDSLFQNVTHNDAFRYQKAIKKIRSGAKTKNQKISAINNQVKYMTLMFNAGSDFGGTSSAVSHFQNSHLQAFKTREVNDIWSALNVPASRTKSSILGDVSKVWNTLQYFNFVETKGLEKKKNPKFEMEVLIENPNYDKNAPEGDPASVKFVPAPPVDPKFDNQAWKDWEKKERLKNDTVKTQKKNDRSKSHT